MSPLVRRRSSPTATDPTGSTRARAGWSRVRTRLTPTSAGSTRDGVRRTPPTRSSARGQPTVVLVVLGSRSRPARSAGPRRKSRTPGPAAGRASAAPAGRSACCRPACPGPPRRPGRTGRRPTAAGPRPASPASSSCSGVRPKFGRWYLTLPSNSTASAACGYQPSTTLTSRPSTHSSTCGTNGGSPSAAKISRP